MKINLRKYKPELCVSEDYSRPHLNHPHLNVDKSRLEATSGHILGVFPVEIEKEDVSGHIDRRVFAIERDEQSDLSSASVVVTGEGTIGNSVTIQRPQRSDPFPSLDDLLKTVPDVGDEDTVTFAIDAELLRKLAEAIGAADGRKVRLTVRGPEDPIRVEAFHGEVGVGDAFGVIMGLKL